MLLGMLQARESGGGWIDVTRGGKGKGERESRVFFEFCFALLNYCVNGLTDLIAE